MSAVAEQKQLVKGGAFLIEERSPEEIFTPEDFTEEHRMIADTTRQFIDNEVVTRIDELEKHDWKLARELVSKAAELGLIGANIPEEFGGLGLDQTSGALIGENIGRSASFATTPVTRPVTKYSTTGPGWVDGTDPGTRTAGGTAGARQQVRPLSSPTGRAWLTRSDLGRPSQKTTTASIRRFRRRTPHHRTLTHFPRLRA